MAIQNSSAFSVDNDGAVLTKFTTKKEAPPAYVSNDQIPVDENGRLVQAVEGNLTVTMDTQIEGENPTYKWLEVVNAAATGIHVLPTAWATADMPTEMLLGTAGARAGDYIDSITLNVTSNTNSAVYISQDGIPALLAGTTGTSPTATTTLAVTALTNQTIAANFYRGKIIKVTYLPAGFGTYITVRRRIVSHAAVTASTALSFTLTHALIAGSAIQSWQIEPSTSYELVPYNLPAGGAPIVLSRRERSTYGAWRINVDIGVEAHVVGRFT